jgi:hypothetical protein
MLGSNDTQARRYPATCSGEGALWIKTCIDGPLNTRECADFATKPDVFIEHLAPRPEQVIAWVHYGASLACYQWAREGDHWATTRAVDNKSGLSLASESLTQSVRRHFQSIAGVHLVGAKAAVGELRNVFDAGYVNFIGMVSTGNVSFHTPGDLEKFLWLAVADVFGVNSAESEGEQTGIIRGQIRGS